MRINKKVLALFLAIAMAVSISGCTPKSSDTTSASAETSKAAPTEISAAEASIVSEKVELVISAAASLTDVAAEIAEMYKSVAPNVSISYSFGSSGALQTQIEEGAPSDIFMSAAKKQMTALEGKNLIEEDKEKDLLVNKVVLITPKDSTKGITKFEDATTDKVSKIALGEPSSVPVGQYSEEIFNFLGILDKVKLKANYGSDVRQVLTWVESGEVDCGVVYATDAAASQKVKVICEAPKDSHKPVIYPVAVLKNSKHFDEANAFLNFLSSPEVVKVFEKYGFKMN